jgi:hypothetical protein
MVCMGFYLNQTPNPIVCNSKKFQNYNCFDLYGYSHELQTKLYGL